MLEIETAGAPNIGSKENEKDDGMAPNWSGAAACRRRAAQPAALLSLVPRLLPCGPLCNQLPLIYPRSPHHALFPTPRPLLPRPIVPPLRLHRSRPPPLLSTRSSKLCPTYVNVGRAVVVPRFPHEIPPIPRHLDLPRGSAFCPPNTLRHLTQPRSPSVRAILILRAVLLFLAQLLPSPYRLPAHGSDGQLHSRCLPLRAILQQ